MQPKAEPRHPKTIAPPAARRSPPIATDRPRPAIAPPHHEKSSSDQPIRGARRVPILAHLPPRRSSASSPSEVRVGLIETGFYYRQEPRAARAAPREDRCAMKKRRRDLKVARHECRRAGLEWPTAQGPYNASDRTSRKQRISFYSQGGVHRPLHRTHCRRPAGPSTQAALGLRSLLRATKKRPMLQRIYGTAFLTERSPTPEGA